MQAEIVAQLLALNRQFYQTFALQFSATRQRLQLGVRKILQTIPADVAILDLGCGNGELAKELDRGGHSSRYVGLDFSRELLAEVSKHSWSGLSAEFVYADIASPDWSELISGFQPQFIFAFAVLHHLPGDDLRLQVLRQANTILAPGGFFIHSVWQFLNSPRLRRRIQPWEVTGIDASQLETGDYLLDWRSGGQGLRYVHHFSEEELADLADAAGFDVCETFLSDGEGSRLGLYQRWSPRSSQ